MTLGLPRGLRRARALAPVLLGAALLAACAPSPDVGPTQGAHQARSQRSPPAGTAPAGSRGAPAATAPAATAPAATTPAGSSTRVPAVPEASETPGRYPIVTETLPLVDTSRPTVSRGRTLSAIRALTTVVWRPAGPGRWPLIVFAHGFEVGPTPYVALLEAWASAGYVVAAPEFPLTDAAVAGAALDENDIQNQPADVRYVVDTLVAPTTPLSADIDPNEVVFAGHSDGAETVLAASLAPVPDGEPSARAVLAMSPSPLIGVTATANPPLLVTQGDADTIKPPALGQQTYREGAAPKYYLDLLGGGHLPPLEAGSQWLPTLESATLTFFHLYLYGGTPVELLVAGNAPGLTTITGG